MELAPVPRSGPGASQVTKPTNPSGATPHHWDQLCSKACANPLARALGTASCTHHPTPFSLPCTAKVCSRGCAPEGAAQQPLGPKGAPPGCPIVSPTAFTPRLFPAKPASQSSVYGAKPWVWDQAPCLKSYPAWSRADQTLRCRAEWSGCVDACGRAAATPSPREGAANSRDGFVAPCLIS